jgi:hypothetical protein
MGSTETDRGLLEFFEQRLTPLAKRLRERGVSYFARTPDPREETYYVRRDDASDYVFNYDSHDAAAQLRDRWAGQGLPELADLTPELVELLAARRERADRWEDVSPFIYAMF